jgi:hypothetical protein
MMRSLSNPGLRRRRLLGLACCSMLSGAVFRDVAAQSRQMPLDSPAGLTANDVTVRAAQHAGRSGVAVELTDSAQKQLLAGTGIGNGPTFAMPELRLANGWMEVDVAAQINGRGAPDSRGFVGLAFHIADDLKTFEAVYLRMTNGSLNDPPPPAPRNVYAVQYIAFPDRYWRRLRQEFPNRYERAAPVALGKWHRLRLEIAGAKVRALVDGQEVLVIDDLSFADRAGRIGLWVDDGTTGYFANLTVSAAT